MDDLTGKPHPYPEWVERAWRTAYLRAKGAATAQWLWERVFSMTERQRLGGDLAKAYEQHRGTVGMWVRLHGVSVPRAVVAITTRCHLLDPDTGRALLRAFGEAPDDPAGDLNAAVRAGGLVLAEAPRRAYWGGHPIPIDWCRNGGLWTLLLELARASKGGEAVDVFRLRSDSGEIEDPGYVKKLKSRLVRAEGFPGSLADLIVLCGRGTYRLDLPAERIRVFEQGAVPLREWVP